MNHGVNLVVALRPEADPIIEHFDLKRQPSSRRVSIFANEGLTLAVSGLGKTAAANAVADLKSFNPDQVSAWFNIGIAGHQSLGIGEGYLVNRVNDKATEQTWYPMFVFDHGCSTGIITTVDQVETEYTEPTGYDMEASGFVAAAFRLATVEMVHCYKIVSDNSPATLSKLTPQRVSKLVESHVQTIERLIHSLDDLAADLAARNSRDQLLQPFLENWKFSVTQQHMLFKLLRKSKALGCIIDVNTDIVRECQSGKEVIQKISDQVNSYWSQQHSNV